MGLISLVTGGVRSGKSRHAEELATLTGLEVVVVATAREGDPEMQERIRRHRASRPKDWIIVEEPLALGSVVRAQAHAGRCVLIDCLTLWLTNLLEAEPARRSAAGVLEPGTRLSAERSEMLEALATATGEIILVSNEVGAGVVPTGELSRLFVDKLGHLNQAVAALAHRVVWMVAGCPVYVKGKH